MTAQVEMELFHTGIYYDMYYQPRIHKYCILDITYRYIMFASTNEEECYTVWQGLENGKNRGD